MTPIRIGASCARTSLPPRPAAARVAAEFVRSDLRDVTAAMMTSLWNAPRPVATPQLFRRVFEEPLAESTRPSDRPAPERGPTRPEPIGHAGEKVRLRPSGKALFGLSGKRL